MFSMCLCVCTPVSDHLLYYKTFNINVKAKYVDYSNTICLQT